MPTLGNHLDFAKLEARSMAVHNLTAAPSSPVKGQLYFNSTANELYYWDGAIWQSAKSGAGSSGPPSGPAGGGLTGTYPNPTIAADAIANANVAAAAAIAESKLALASDAAAGTASRRTLGTGAQQAMAGSTRLDTIAAPTGAVSANSQKITNLATPTVASDAANMGYVDAVAQGLDAKASVRVAYTTNQSLTGAAVAEGGTTPANGERALVIGQSSQPANGIYLVNNGGAWTRAPDADTWNDLVSAFVFVEAGSNADNGFVCTVDPGGTLNTTAVTWTQFSGAGQITSGAGLTKTGNTLDVGAGAGIQVNADSVQVANNGITNAMIADGAVSLSGADVTGTLPTTRGGTGMSTSAWIPRYYGAAGPPSGAATWTILQSTHNMAAARGILVQVADQASGAVELPDIAINAGGDVTITYAASVTANSKYVTLVGP